MKALFFILLLFIQPSALASWTTGNKLNGDLNAEALEFYRGGFAMGFISAIASRESDSILEVLEGLKNISENNSIKQIEKRETFLATFEIVKRYTACIPSGVTQGQLEAIVKKWLALNPERWNESAAVLVKEALLNSFPCKNVEDLWK